MMVFNKRKLVQPLLILSFYWWTSIAQGANNSAMSTPTPTIRHTSIQEIHTTSLLVTTAGTSTGEISPTSSFIGSNSTVVSTTKPDVDECTSKPCHANATCNNTEGSYVCACHSGYSGNGVSCTDVDECTSKPCHANATCNNTEGSYMCACDSGYSGNGVHCTDVDECTSKPCHANATCNNTEGSYMCACHSGYSGNGVSCKDVDECTSKPCHANATCNNTEGSYMCACHSGYSGNGVSCKDIDECSDKTARCHEDANCTNTGGSFNCTCKLGFIGDGLDCVGPPNFVIRPNNAIVVEGKNATFNCSAESNPPPTITWYKSNSALQPEASHIKFSWNNQTVTIINARRTDAGIYKCIAQNKINRTSAIAILDVQYPPTVMLNIDQHDRNQIQFKKNVTFICNVTSNPNSTINWKKGSTDVTKCSKCEVTTEGNYGVLSIYNLTRNDTANYTCLANNTHGNDSDTKELIVLSPPDPPNSIVIKSVTAYSIFIQWSKGAFDGNSPIANYSVEYRNGVNWSSPIFAGKSLKANITKLSPFTNYTFQVCSRNNIGITCTMAHGTTKESEPSKPLKVNAVNVSSTELNVTWMEPERRNGILTGYTIYSRRVKNDRNENVNPIITVSNITNQTFLLLSGLEKYSIYQIEVAARTQIGEGPKSDNITARTNEDQPTKPLNVIAVNVSSTALNVTWTEPERRNGILTGYTIYYRLIRNDKNENVTAATIVKQNISPTFFNLIGLEKYSVYDIQVTARTRIGEGPKSDNITARTNEDLPNVAHNLAARNTSSKTLLVTWSPPSDPNGVITGYELRWQMKENDKEKEIVNATINKTNIGPVQEHTISGLYPYSLYKVTLRAKTKIGFGTDVSEASAKTDEDEPTKPLNVSAVNVSSTALKVTWTEPERRNGILTGYTIYYRLIRNDKNENVTAATNVSQMISQTSINLTGLEKYSVYEIQVTARTRIGEGEKSDILTARTKDDLPNKPLAVNAVNVSSTELNVTWMEPKRRNGILTGYTIYYKLVTNDKNENVTATSSTFSKNTTHTSSKLVGLGKSIIS